MWCGGARETYWAMCHIGVTPSETKEFFKSSCFFRYEPFLNLPNHQESCFLNKQRLSVSNSLGHPIFRLYAWIKNLRSQKIQKISVPWLRDKIVSLLNYSALLSPNLSTQKGCHGQARTKFGLYLPQLRPIPVLSIWITVPTHNSDIFVRSKKGVTIWVSVTIWGISDTVSLLWVVTLRK